MLRRLMEEANQQAGEASQRVGGSAIEEVEQKITRVLEAAAEISNLKPPIPPLAQEVRRKLEALLQLTTLRERFPLPRSRKYKWTIDYLTAGLSDDPTAWPTLLGWLFTHTLGKVVGTASFEQTSRVWIDEWLLGRIIADALRDLGLDEGAAWRAVEAVKLLTSHQRWFETETPKTRRAHAMLQIWLDDQDVRRYLQINRHADVVWFNKEAFDQLLWGMLAIATITISADPNRPADEIATKIVACYDVVRALQRAEEKSEYQIEKLLKAA
jgi:hypothetical protein